MSKVDDVIAWAGRELGKPYVYGDEGPNTFDCSGLMQFIFAKVGVTLPRVADAQYHATARTSTPVPGDLIFYLNNRTGVADHVTLFIGGGKMIEAPHAGANVRTSSVYELPGYTRVYGRVSGLGAAAAGVLAPITEVGTSAVSWTSDQISNILGGARTVALEAVIAVAGLALIGLGLYRFARPKIEAKTSELENLL